EGHRWDDLRRYGRVVTVMNALQEIDLRTGQRVNYNMTQTKELLPIPQQERDRNKQLDQNPGYN
ncbi:MAG TPA: RagB/SusD family nutrient uptake outer membrane protein, partial [Chitinophaga sp.]